MLRSKRKFEVGKFFRQKKILWYSLMIRLQTYYSRIQVHGGLVQVHGSWIVTLSIALYRHCLLKSNSFSYSKGSVLLFSSVGGKSYFFRFSPWFFVSIQAEGELQVGCLERMASFECGEKSVFPSYWLYLDAML